MGSFGRTAFGRLSCPQRPDARRWVCILHLESPHCIPDVLTPQRMGKVMGRVAQPGQHVVPWVKVGNATLAQYSKEFRALTKCAAPPSSSPTR